MKYYFAMPTAGKTNEQLDAVIKQAGCTVFLGGSRHYSRESYPYIVVQLDLTHYPSCCALATASGITAYWGDKDWIARTKGNWTPDSVGAARHALGMEIVYIPESYSFGKMAISKFGHISTGFGVLVADVDGNSLSTFFANACAEEGSTQNMRAIDAFNNPNTGRKIGLWMIEYKNRPSILTIDDLETA